jgi:hypothetical protein
MIRTTLPARSAMLGLETTETGPRRQGQLKRALASVASPFKRRP